MSTPFPSAFAGVQAEITRALEAAVGGPSELEAAVGGPSENEAAVGGPSKNEAAVGGPSKNESALSGPNDNDRVLAAMRYTLLASSKRVRAMLVLLSAEVCGDRSRAMAAAVAVECIHASSLILDDLPSMDDAPLRRGRPSAHVAYGEAVAVLAAFGLLNLAYGHLARAYPPAIAAKITSLYCDAVGLDGLIAGQAEDVLATDAAVDFNTLERIHRRKTGVLFSAAAHAGAVTAGANDAAIASLTSYAKNLGLAFQIVDDLLDVVGTEAETGKPVRADARKTTFVSFSGVDGARELAAELCATAEHSLEPFGARAHGLRELAHFVASRRI